MIERREDLTPREWATMNHDKEMTEKAYEQQLKVKELDIQASKLEAKITSWFKLPITIIKLPLYLLFIIPLTVYAVKGKDVPENYWALLR